MTQTYGDDPGVSSMLAYQDGDEDAFDHIVETYSGQVFALLTRFLGPVPGREDMVQEVFLRVIRARENYQPTARLSTWLYRIAFNLAVNATQRRGPDQHSQELADDDVGRSGRDGARALAQLEDERSEEPSNHLEREDVVHAVREAIERLPESQRAALILAKYEELPYAEIAQVLDSSEKAVKSLIHRARENLRESLAPFLEQELS